MPKKIKVLIIDDSAVMRELLKTILCEDRAIDVVGVAADPIIAKKKITKLRPDVLTLDVEMPRMDGLTFLKDLMSIQPMPVVMVSSYTDKGATETFRALELGAIDYITKPNMKESRSLDSFIQELREKVREAAKAKIRSDDSSTKTRKLSDERESLERIRATHRPNRGVGRRERIVVLGASTGGTQAIQVLAEVLPADTPGIAIVQHMPPRFTSLYAERLDKLSLMDVREARDGDHLRKGQILIAPGAFHMSVRYDSGGYAVRVFDGKQVNQHKPSVEVLFDSSVELNSKNILGIILTGMGKDGASAMSRMHQSGSYTIAQDKKSCVIFGMPDQAIKMGGVSKVLPLDRIAEYIARWAVGDLVKHKVAGLGQAPTKK